MREKRNNFIHFDIYCVTAGWSYESTAIHAPAQLQLQLDVSLALCIISITSNRCILSYALFEMDKECFSSSVSPFAGRMRT